MGEEQQPKKIKKVIIALVSTVTIVGITAGLAWLNWKKADTKTEDKIEEPEQKIIQTTGKKSDNQNISLNKIEVSSGGKGSRKKMGDYYIIGEIEIPKTGLKCSILDQVSTRSLEMAIAQMFTVNGLNQPGNTVLFGHNYKNTLFFSKNEELVIGDKFYITDESGVRKEYIIYDKFETKSTDTSFYTRDANATGNLAETTLSTCTDDANDTDRRLIIIGKEVVQE